MTGRLAWALAGLLVAGAAVSAAAQDNARKKGGGDGGSSRGGSSSRGSSESAGARHTGGGGSRSGGEVRSDGGGGSQRERGSSGRGSSATSRRETTGAEARHPEPGTGHGYRGRYYGYAGSSYYYFRPSYSRSYRPYFGWYGVPYYDWYYDDPFYYGGGGGYYGGVYGSYYPRYRYRDSGSIRTLVEPEQTKVFVDGYYAGTVDDFDGMFQRLYVGPGRHDISFKLEGYRTHRVMVYATDDNTIKIRHDMQRGTGDETVEDLSGGRTEPPYRVSEGPDPRDRERERERAPYDDRRDDRRGRDVRDGGALRLDVRPDDASVYVDGEFYGSARRAGIINLAPGRHRVEVVRPGHRTVERDVEIQPGRTETLAIDLERMD